MSCQPRPMWTLHNASFVRPVVVPLVSEVGLPCHVGDHLLAVPIETEYPDNVAIPMKEGLGRVIFDGPGRKLAVSHWRLQAVAAHARVEAPQHIAGGVENS